MEHQSSGQGEYVTGIRCLNERNHHRLREELVPLVDKTKETGNFFTYSYAYQGSTMQQKPLRAPCLPRSCILKRLTGWNVFTSQLFNHNSANKKLSSRKF